MYYFATCQTGKSPVSRVIPSSHANVSKVVPSAVGGERVLRRSTTAEEMTLPSKSPKLWRIPTASGLRRKLKTYF